MSGKTRPFTYLEWLALTNLYQHRDLPSSPVRYVGLIATIKGLLEHKPPLVQWVGKRSDNQIHITDAGIAVFETQSES